MEAKVKEDLLPHFTVKLMLELRRRMCDRVDEIIDDDFSTHDVAARCYPTLNYEQFRDDIARDMVSRIYRTQLREAQAVLSFSEAMIEHNNQHNPERKLYRPGEQGDTAKFDETVKVGLAAIREAY